VFKHPFLLLLSFQLALMALNEKESEVKKKPHEMTNAEFVSKLMGNALSSRVYLDFSPTPFCSCDTVLLFHTDKFAASRSQFLFQRIASFAGTKTQSGRVESGCNEGKINDKENSQAVNLSAAIISEATARARLQKAKAER
jgi:hypothetical protein